MPRFRVETVPRRRTLPEPANGSTLPIMVGAVIYVRVSTKEQTDRSQLQRLLTDCRLNKGRVHFVVVFNLTRFARARRTCLAQRRPFCPAPCATQ